MLGAVSTCAALWKVYNSLFKSGCLQECIELFNSMDGAENITMRRVNVRFVFVLIIMLACINLNT